MTFTSDITVREIAKMQMGSDNMIAGAAWVSTNAFDALKKAEEDLESVPGVINYLMKHRHGTPFEHGAITMYVHAPIFVWREWHRHRIGWSYNEESARYHKLEPVFFIPRRERPMFKIEDWKPGRPKFMTIDGFASHNNVNDIWPLASKPMPISYQGRPEDWMYDCLVDNLKDDYTRSYDHYVQNLDMGFDPGLARDGLNIGIYSSNWVTANPRSLMSFLSLRQYFADAKFISYPLYEINEAANQVEVLLKKYWPIVHDAYVKNGRVSP